MTKTNLKIYCGKLDLVPLIDLFFLLVIFMLIGSSLVFRPGIQVQLPKAAAAEMRGVPKIVVTITQSGGLPPSGISPSAGGGDGPASAATSRSLLFFNDNQVTWPDLEQKLRQAVHERRLDMGRIATREEKQTGLRENPLLVLRADAAVPYQRIVQVMSLGRSLGLGVFLVTESNEDRMPPPGPVLP
ncbi:MAG: biopolymer transporter ExbD [Lentisphaeria bacterium]|nr:biopolymer transporter ExbD [Lentisphaeria bacterium]